MTGTRLIIATLLVAGMVAPIAARTDGNVLLPRKPRPDQSRVRFLAELLRSDPDEKKRKAAVTELADADPRAYPEVMTALITALKKDAAAVRAAAAEVIGKFKTTFPLAGAALESTAESDPDSTVRTAAKQALWDYHLNGYRTAKVTDATIVQTAEPPFAPSRAIAPMPVALRPIVAKSTSQRLPDFTSLPPAAVIVPATATIPGPRQYMPDRLNTPRSLLSLPTKPSFTSEPPLAKRTGQWVPPPVNVTEPPLFISRAEVGRVGKPPLLIFDLPSIVPNPGPLPGVPPFSDATQEPPVRKVSK